METLIIRHISPVTRSSNSPANVCSPIIGRVLLIVFLGIVALGGEDYVKTLDLTSWPQKSTRFDGPIVMSQVLDGHQTSSDLPISIRLLEVKRSKPSKQFSPYMTVIEITNTSRSEFPLPVSIDQKKLVLNTTGNVRVFTFGILFSSPEYKNPDEQVLAVTAGADSDAASLMMIHPGERIKVLALLERPADLPRHAAVQLKVVCSESMWANAGADAGVIIKQSSKKVESTNAITYKF